MSVRPQEPEPANQAPAPPAVRRWLVPGFWAVAFAFLIVMAFATLPSPLYGLYRERDGLSTLTVTIVYAIFAGSTIATLLAVQAIVSRVGRHRVMIGAVATMMVAAGVLAAWKALPGLLVGRLLTGIAVGLAAGTAIAYLIELRILEDPGGSPVTARNVGTAVNVGALGIGPLVAGCLAEWVRVFTFGTLSMLTGLALLVTSVQLSAPSLALFLLAGTLIGAGAGAGFKGTTGLVLEATPPEGRVEMTSDLLISLFVGLSIPVIGAGVALNEGASPPDTVLGFAIFVGLGVLGAGALLGHVLKGDPRRA